MAKNESYTGTAGERVGELVVRVKKWLEQVKQDLVSVGKFLQEV